MMIACQNLKETKILSNRQKFSLKKIFLTVAQSALHYMFERTKTTGILITIKNLSGLVSSKFQNQNSNSKFRKMYLVITIIINI